MAICNTCTSQVSKYVSAHMLARCVHGVNMRVQVLVLKLISVAHVSMYLRAQVNLSLSFCVKGVCPGTCARVSVFCVGMCVRV